MRIGAPSAWGAATAAAGLAAIVAACGSGEPASVAPPEGAAPAPEPVYVGSAACTDCHAEQAALFHGTDHDRAMEVAGEDSVLGDFGGAELVHYGETWRFERRGERFVVKTTGPDGAMGEYEVKYTFGVRPLQQYLVALPGGRLQALTAAWDSRSAERGGQRWFHLHPDEATPPGDVLHWAGPAQNWNTMCAECHSTAVREGYDPASNTFDTTWAGIDVGCEACHGPGSRHVERARQGDATSDTGLVVDLANEGRWVLDAGAAIAHRAEPRTGHAELDTCAPCHSRRSSLREAPLPGRPFLDGYRPALLDAGLYQPDGQILGEVYVWGSFVQSRMYAAGVTCSDCHDPHSLAVADPPDATCRRCHRPEVFSTPSHHHHAEGSPGASCVACHMPERTYMVVDDRRDHSLRVPRPDLSVELGTTNACTDCHADRPAAWAARAAREWWGAPRRAHFAAALDAGRRGLPDADARLAALAGDDDQPAIARATALSLLRDPSRPASARALSAGLGDPDGLVRLGALDAAERIDPHSRLALVKSALRDPLLAVRIEAGRVLADVPGEALSAGDRTALDAALDEYRASQELHAAQPTAQLNLGVLAARLGDLAGARRAYETAVRLAPWFVPGTINLADLLRASGDEAGAERVLRRGLAAVPDSPEIHHALGLALVRRHQLDAALVELARAAELAPEQPRFAYVYAVGLHSAGREAEAVAVLDAALALHPRDPQLLQALADFQSD